MFIGLTPLGINSALGSPSNPFTPIALFSAGQQGGWWEPSDFTSLFQDAAGSIPVTTVEQPVAVMLDKRLGLVRGPELVAGQTWSSAGVGAVGGINNVTFVAATAGSGGASAMIVANKLYEITYTISGITSGSIGLDVGGGAAVQRAANGSYTERKYANASGILTANCVGTTTSGVFTINSCKLINGNHVKVVNSVVSARVNLLIGSEDVRTSWVFGGGGFAADAITYSSASANGSMYESVATVPGASYSFIWEAKNGTATNIAYAVYDESNAGFLIAQTAYDGYINNASLSRIGIQFTAPAGCLSVRLYPVGGIGTAGTSVITRFVLTRIGAKITGVVIGDSFTAANILSPTAALLSSTTITQKGVSGNKLSDIQARFNTDVVALSPTYVEIQGGINDIANATTDPTGGMQSQITTMVSQAQAAGIKVILTNVSPWKTYTSWTVQRQGWHDAYNAWLVSYASSNSFQLVDIYALLVDPANPYTLLPAYDSGDHLHPSTAGYKVIGAGAASVIGRTVPAASLPNYQRVNTATDYNAVGFPKYLTFNGSTSAAQTFGSIDFSATDKMTVVAGVRKLSDAALGIVTELNSGSAVPGTFWMTAPYNTGLGGDYAVYGGGTTSVRVTSTAILAPNTSVLTEALDISGPSLILRRNGTQVASNFASQGTGNFGNYPLFIGARNAASLFFNGNLYGLIVRGAASTAGEVAATEMYVNSKTGAY